MNCVIEAYDWIVRKIVEIMRALGFCRIDVHQRQVRAWWSDDRRLAVPVHVLVHGISASASSELCRVSRAEAMSWKSLFETVPKGAVWLDVFFDRRPDGRASIALRCDLPSLAPELLSERLQWFARTSVSLYADYDRAENKAAFLTSWVSLGVEFPAPAVTLEELAR